MSLKKKALKGVFWSLMKQFGTLGIGFIVTTILARLLLPEEFGLIAMIAIFIGIGNALMNAGLGSSLIRTKNPTQDDYSTVFFFNLFGSLVVYCIVFILAPLVSEFYNQNILTGLIRLYSLTFIINSFSLIQNTRLTKLMDFKKQLIVSIPSLIISGGVGIYLAYNDYGVWSLVWQALTFSLVSSIFLWYWSKWSPSLIFSITKFKYHFNFGYKLTLSSILETLFKNLYFIIIGKYFMVSQVGFYHRAISLQNLPVGSISTVIGNVSYPLFAEMKDDDVRLKNVYKVIMQMIVYILAPTLIVMSVLGEPLFRFLFTEKWLSAVPYFQILTLNGILYPIHAYNLNILKVKGRSDLFLKLEIIKKVLIVCVIVVSFQYGIFGLLYGSVIASIASFFINTHYAGYFIKYTTFDQAKDVLPTLLIAGLIGVLVYFTDLYVKRYIEFDLVRLAIGFFVSLITYLPLTYLLKFNSLNELIKIVKRK
jgi:teichuronic acid exporter